MKWIPKYQKAGKLNFKTTGLPWQQSKEDQEVARHAQSVGIPNPTNLKSRLQPASKNLKAKYNNLSTKERLALAKKSMPHSEIITVKDQQGNTKTDTNPQAGAMSGADPVGEFIVGTAAGNLGLGLGKLALSKMGQNTVSHWARNSLLNETAGNLTKNIATPLMESEAVPLEDGFVYRTFTPSHGGWVRDGRVYNRSYGLGDVRIQDGKYYSVRQAHFNNPDKLWWDKFGHNRGQVVQVTNEANTQTLQDAAKNGFNLDWGAFNKGYRLSDPIKTNEVINYKLDPLTNTMVPSMPGKIINNKQTPSEILSTPIVNNYSYLNGTYTGFKGIKSKLNHHLQGEDAVKMFKEYGGTPIPEKSLNGDQLRKYVTEARERYGLLENNNISDEEIAQALYKHTNELGKGSAAINSQGEPQLLFRGDTKAYTQLKDHISPEKLVENKGTMDNSLGTLFTGEFPGTLQDRFDTMGSSRYLDGWNFNPTINKWQWRGSGTESNFNKQEGYLMFSHPHPNYKLAQRGQYVGFKKAASTPEHPNDLNAFIVKTPAMRDATREISVLNDDFLVLQPTFKTNRFKWDTSKERIVDTSGKIDDVIEDNPNLGQRLAVGEHYTNVLQDAQKNNQGLLKSSRVGENGVTSDNSLREEHAHYSYFALPNFNKQNAKHILPYDLRIPRNWSDPNIFRVAAPVGMSLPFLNNSQK